jgi:hypothetical protein
MNKYMTDDEIKEFDEEFCKGGEWIAPNMKGKYIKCFINSLLKKREERIVEIIDESKEVCTDDSEWNEGLDYVLELIKRK